MPLHTNLGALARNSAAGGQDPQSAGSIINLIDAPSKGSDRLSHGADNRDFFIREASRIRIDVADLNFLACRQRESGNQDGQKITDSLGCHVAPYLLVTGHQVID